MITVGQFLEQNKRTIWALSSQNTVKQALQLLADKNIGAVLVKDQDKLVGIFSERDYARKVILKGKNSIDTKLYEVMTANLTTITADLKIDECMQLMTDNFIRHLPVMDKEKCIGIVSIGDVVKMMINEQKYLIEELKKYISG